MSSIGKNNLCYGSQNNCSLWGGGRKVMSRRVKGSFLYILTWTLIIKVSLTYKNN